MELRKLTIDDRAVLEPYLFANKYGVCDFSYSNMFMWRHTYRVDYAVHKGFLVVLSSDFVGERHFFMPLGGGGQGDIREVLGDMIAASAALGRDFRMIGITDAMISELEFLGSGFLIHPAQVWDYVYNAEDLIRLRGKKFHAKRNHINKFNSLYSYEYRAMRAADVPLCMELLDTWSRSGHEGDFAAAEKRAVGEALTNFDKLGMDGGCLFVEGKLGAFALGQPINSEMYAIHAEKALPSYEGIYSKINQMFAEQNCSGFKYINREEDLGIEGLRKSKMSYNPAFLLEKRVGVLHAPGT